VVLLDAADDVCERILKAARKARQQRGELDPVGDFGGGEHGEERRELAADADRRQAAEGAQPALRQRRMPEVARADHLEPAPQPGVAAHPDPGLDRFRPGTLGRLELIEETDDLYRQIVRLVPEHGWSTLRLQAASVKSTF